MPDPTTLFTLTVLPILSVPLLVWPMGWISGWYKLSQAYRPPESDSGVIASLGFQHCQLRYLMGYNGCTRWDVYESHVVIRVWPVFRLGHPPIWLPWNETTFESEQLRLGGTRIRVRTAAVADVSILISQRLGQQLRRCAFDFDLQTAQQSLASLGELD